MNENEFDEVNWWELFWICDTCEYWGELKEFTDEDGELCSSCDYCIEIHKKNATMEKIDWWRKCDKKARSKGGYVVSFRYINRRTKLWVKCSEGHIWGVGQHELLHRDHWCETCYLIEKKPTPEDFRYFAVLRDAERKGEWLGPNYIDATHKMKWRCSKGHIWRCKWSNIFHGTWCPYCAGNARLLLKDCQKLAKSRGGKCLDTSYKNNNTLMLWECAEGHRFKRTMQRVKDDGGWCPDCGISMSQQTCRDIVTNITGLKFETNAYILCMQGLELDGYCEDGQLAFEYNGVQHYEFNKYFHRNIQEFEAQQSRDVKKIGLCEKFGIKLLVVPYYYSYENPDEMEEFIAKELNRLGVIIKKKD